MARPDPVPTHLQEGTQHFPSWGSCSAPSLVSPALLQPVPGIPSQPRLHRVPVQPSASRAGLGAAVVGAALGPGLLWGRDTVTPLAPVPGESRQHLPSTRGGGAGVGADLSPWQEACRPAGVWAVSRVSSHCWKFFRAHSPMRDVGIWFLKPGPVCQSRLVPGSPLGGCPRSERYRSAPCLHPQHRLCRCRGLVVAQRVGVALLGCLTCPHNAWALAGTPTRPLTPGCSEPEGKGGLVLPGGCWALGDGGRLPSRLCHRQG